MADGVTLSAGSADGAKIATDDSGANGHVQYIKLMFGADNTFTVVSASNGLPIAGTVDLGATDNAVLDSIVAALGGTLVVDASGATVPVSHAALTELAAAINASSQMDVNVAAGTVAVTHAALTELAAAINGSSQMDVNIAASGATVPVSNAGLTELAAAINASSQMDVNIAANGVGLATSAKQDTIIGHVDGIETLIGTTNTTLTTIDGRVDGVETLLTAIDGHVDGIEGTQASIVTAVQKIDDPVLVDDAAFTPATSSVMMAGFEADESSTDSVDEGDAGAARMTLDRKQIVTLQPHTAGGLSTFMASGADGSSILVATKQTIKASAGLLYGWYLYNPEAAATFINIYNTDTVTVGTTNPQIQIALPAGAAANMVFPVGITFSTAMSCSATTTAGGNTAPATGVSAVIFYA